MAKVRKNYTITTEAEQLLRALAKKWGQSRSAMLELIIREKAKADNIKLK